MKDEELVVRKKMVKKEKVKNFITLLFGMIIAFTFGGAGLSILFNSKGDLTSVTGGFALIAIALTIGYKTLENE